MAVRVPEENMYSCHISSLASQDVEAQADPSPCDVCVPQSSSESTAMPSVSLDGNQNAIMATVHSCSNDTKF